MNRLRILRYTLMAAALAATVTPAFAGKQGRIDLATMVTPIYTVEGNAFVRHNGDRYSNRPLYCNHIYAIVLAGDKPCAMVGKQSNIYGNLMFALIRNGKGTWLQNASDITSKYRPGRMEWIVKDAGWGGTAVHLEIVPSAQGPGMAAHLRIENAQAGDKLAWASGAATIQKGSILWVYDLTSLRSGLEKRGFVPEDCQDNLVKAQGSSWTILANTGGRAQTATGQCSAPTQVIIGDASAWQDPAALLASHGSSEPIACGTVPAVPGQDVYWTLLGPGAGTSGKSPAEEFAAGMEREKSIEDKVVVDTPDPWLNAAVGACSNVVDACYRDGVYTHSGMRWSTALLGWRTVFGGTVFGWHDLVKDDAALFIGNQITDTEGKTAPVADPKTRLSSQAPESRMFGKGRIALDHPHHYDMQSQFFDQIQHAWRWTGDPALEKLLTPSLDLDCEYIKDCFDPEGLGIYESYANTWPTDDQYYNGGGTSEETAYAYRAEMTALELAQRAGDQQRIQLHTAALERIRKGFFDLLWIKDKGYPGAYREQIGLKRLHESCWLYAIFCPIDAGLLTTEQSAEALQYTEWGLERMKMPYGGEQCWPSNWVPSIWSVREMWSGDDYQLALAYCQTGLPDDAWKVFRGMFAQQLLFGPVPGDMGHPSGGTDFNDCNSMFARQVVEGMFGYIPDYPNGLVKIAPQLPSDWDHASIKTPDMSISYRRQGINSSCDITLVKPCAMEVQLPVSTTAVSSVTVNGTPAKWKLLPGFGRSLVQVNLPSAQTAQVAVTTKDALDTFRGIYLAGNTGDTVTLKAPHGQIVDFHDPQGVLQDGKAANGTVTGTLTANAGNHVVFALTQVGEARQWRMFKINVTDVKTDAYIAGKTNVDVPGGAHFDQVDMGAVMNGDIRTIYQQQYVSPRPNTCSLRLATDGYSTWQMSGGAVLNTPSVTLDNVPSLSDGHGNILAGKGVPFRAPGDAKNIAFTSRWDNWPKQVSVPVNQKGKTAWFLLCGSTNHMEVRIPNAELRMTYADGVVEKLEITPPFNFWTLCPLAGNDYDYKRDAFSLPKIPPTTVQLGQNCRGIVLGWNLRPGVPLQKVTLETLSEEVVIGLMGVTVMN